MCIWTEQVGVGMTFSILESRLRVLMKRSDFHFTFAPATIATWCGWHNFCQKENDFSNSVEFGIVRVELPGRIVKWLPPRPSNSCSMRRSFEREKETLGTFSILVVDFFPAVVLSTCSGILASSPWSTVGQPTKSANLLCSRMWTGFVFVFFL